MAKQATQTEKRLSIDKITCARDVQPRVKTDSTVVAEYAERIAAKNKLPPVVVYFDGEQHWLAEGFHRVAAHKKAHRTQIDCTIRKGSKSDAAWHALQSNKTHGLRRTVEDKQRAVQMAIAHPQGQELSDRAIADVVGVSATMVAKYRPKEEPTAKDGQSRTRKGRDGRAIKTANIGKKKSAKTVPGKNTTASGKTPKPRAESDVEEPVAAAADVENDGQIEQEDPVEVYRLMLENLPGSLAKLAEQVDTIAGKAMDSKAAKHTLARMFKSIRTLFDAEKKLVEDQDAAATADTAES
jgi:ParB-like chromosome segregation protein Spo0J